MNYMALLGAAVALVVGAFLIYTTMTMAITARRPVISMLRAIGGGAPASSATCWRRRRCSA